MAGRGMSGQTVSVSGSARCCPLSSAGHLCCCGRVRGDDSSWRQTGSRNSVYRCWEPRGACTGWEVWPAPPNQRGRVGTGSGGSQGEVQAQWKCQASGKMTSSLVLPLNLSIKYTPWRHPCAVRTAAPVAACLLLFFPLHRPRLRWLGGVACPGPTLSGSRFHSSQSESLAQ